MHTFLSRWLRWPFLQIRRFVTYFCFFLHVGGRGVGSSGLIGKSKFCFISLPKIVFHSVESASQQWAITPCNTATPPFTSPPLQMSKCSINQPMRARDGGNISISQWGEGRFVWMEEMVFWGGCFGFVVLVRGVFKVCGWMFLFYRVSNVVFFFLRRVSEVLILFWWRKVAV